MSSADSTSGWTGWSLRTQCYLIAHWYLFSSFVNCAIHFATLWIVSEGLRCDVDTDSYEEVNWQFYEVILPLFSFGTLGYPYPIIMKEAYNTFVEIPALDNVRHCYYGSIHISRTNAFNYARGIIWFALVLFYHRALYKKYAERLQVFYLICLVNWLASAYQVPILVNTYTIEYNILIVLHLHVSLFFIVIIKNYVKELRGDGKKSDVNKSAINSEPQITYKPPTYEKKAAAFTAGTRGEGTVKYRENLLKA